MVATTHALITYAERRLKYAAACEIADKAAAVSSSRVVYIRLEGTAEASTAALAGVIPASRA